MIEIKLGGIFEIVVHFEIGVRVRQDRVELRLLFLAEHFFQHWQRRLVTAPPR